MHQFGVTRLFTLLGLLLLGFANLSTASPISGMVANAASQLVGQAPKLVKEELGEIFPRGDDIYETQYPCPDEPNCAIKLPVCMTNYSDSRMCTISYTTKEDWGFAALELWDNNCQSLGDFDGNITYDKLQQQPQGYALRSRLPYTVNVQIIGNLTNTTDSSFWIKLWYADSGLQIWDSTQHGGWGTEYNLEGYSGVRLPFQCNKQAVKRLDEDRSELVNASTLEPEGSPSIVARDDMHYEIYPCSHSTGCAHAIGTCKTNHGDSSMCTLAYVTHDDWGFAQLWLYDNGCNKIGYNHYVPYGYFKIQPQGYALGSQLPWTVDIQIPGDPSSPGGGNFNPYIWYAGFGMRQPMVDLKWLDWAPMYLNDGYKTAGLPFQCR